MKTRIIIFIAGIVFSQLGISTGTSSENSAARDLAAAKSVAFGGVGVAGLMSEGERNLRAVLERPDASQQLQVALAHATPAGMLYILVGLRRCDRAASQKIFNSLARPQFCEGGVPESFEVPAKRVVCGNVPQIKKPARRPSNFDLQLCDLCECDTLDT